MGKGSSSRAAAFAAETWPVGEAVRTRTRGGLRGPCLSSSLRAHHGTSGSVVALDPAAPRGVDCAGRSHADSDESEPERGHEGCGGDAAYRGHCFHLECHVVTGDDLFILTHCPGARPVPATAGLCIAGSCK